MTTKKFSATNLPHPRYSLELGRLSIRCKEQRAECQQQQTQDGKDDDDVNLPSTCLPRFSQLAQVIEVIRPGVTLPNRVNSNIRDFLGSYCVIENARPELFVRRDFISKFVDKGTIHISHLSDNQGAPASSTNTPTPPGYANHTGDDTRQSSCGSIVGRYKLATGNNVMKLTMNAKQYHRFGLVAKKVISLSAPGTRRKSKLSSKSDDDLFLVEIDLSDERIKKNNRYQDRLVSALRRLAPISKVYFRFIPDKSKLDLNRERANELSLEFFNHVIEEYALDGCQPVPLTSCTIAQQSIEHNSVNYSQLHPKLDLGKVTAQLSSLLKGRRDNIACPDELETEKSETALAQLIDIVDWLGYQLLRLDSDNLSQLLGWNDGASPKEILDRVDVSCSKIVGLIDFKQVQDNLSLLFNPENSSGDLILRALILYDDKYQEMQKLQLSNSCSNENNTSDSGWTERGTSNSFNSGVVYLQYLSDGLEAAQEITVIGMSVAA